MKREEILAMKPGEELDEIVSREIFGVEMIAHVPYSSDISAAWEVVEKLRESHLYTDIRTCADFYEVWVQIPPFQEEHVQTETIAHPRLPYAICKAALLAVLEEGETK
ncbi:hypothetical protein [Paenibacillus sp. BR1-192]|uniref:BC1872 family protein n=1 Tax=Paenibacillus sp. BR1-192 TaxID=3032287 RepID=UPI00240E11E0|nr:hypothetical protein [Paenibacillus sp. BR1-192]WFB57488.1 hypothetical protein P0X86_26520 [Paenibacillus sp. BR1-192]